MENLQTACAQREMTRGYSHPRERNLKIQSLAGASTPGSLRTAGARLTRESGCVVHTLIMVGPRGPGKQVTRGARVTMPGQS